MRHNSDRADGTTARGVPSRLDFADASGPVRPTPGVR
ncbi:hypothetical protein NRB20_60900 [Nocardia sp. RB20]|uniref:Uncharacterized protein n=1 Tax=Nocardia macrotermitis TaxID=2585198 RepID=A0A7K0DB03_9NOCA|nr:hypothetical protein [Nocardia macrotermitis]